MKRFVLLLLLTISLTAANAQGLANQRKKIINSFIKDILNRKKDNEYIIRRYIEIVPNDTIAIEARNKLMSAMIDSVRTTYSKLLNSSASEIVSYDQYSGSKQFFRDGNNNIEILTVGEVPILYFYFSNEKILSFLFIKKGKEGYFIIP